MTEPAKKKTAAPRLQHVVALTQAASGAPNTFDEVLVFGQELDALRHILGKEGWVYAAVSHGQPLTDALAGTVKS